MLNISFLAPNANIILTAEIVVIIKEVISFFMIISPFWPFVDFSLYKP